MFAFAINDGHIFDNLKLIAMSLSAPNAISPPIESRDPIERALRIHVRLAIKFNLLDIAVSRHRLFTYFFFVRKEFRLIDVILRR